MEENKPSWKNPKELLKLQRLKLKKQALQERFKGNISLKEIKSEKTSAFDCIFAKKRKNPFQVDSSACKKPKHEEEFLSETQDETLYKLLNQTVEPTNGAPVTSFQDILRKAEPEPVPADKPIGAKECPIDWTLKSKLRLISSKPFAWTQKLKISEEASGITSFTRCLDIEKCDTSLDASPNAKFHQCCLFWQQPFLPWLSLFPRTNPKNSSGLNLASNMAVKGSLYNSWKDSLRSLFQLLRTRQCPFFYVCSNSFTALFRASGLHGYEDLHVLITPTTRGFRNLLQEEEIEFTMPLKQEENRDNEPKTEENADEEWMSKLGINSEDIKHINLTQQRIQHKTECQVDSSDQSLVQIEGVEVNSFFNFLLNCKSTISPTGPLAGVPPTLLAPVSFHGATLNGLKVRENKVHSDGLDFYSLELSGPILPSTIHNLFNINCPDNSVTIMCNNVESMASFSKIVPDGGLKNGAIFGKENLKDCGLSGGVLGVFCGGEVAKFECVKYCGDSQSFTWT